MGQPRRRIAALFLPLLLIVNPVPVSPGTMAQAASIELPVPLIPQETDMWCWAASTAMVLAYFHHQVPPQCSQANLQFARTDCCTSRPPRCIEGGWPEFQKFGFTFQRTHGRALSWDALLDQLLTKQKPIAFSWHWTGTSGHMMVITGYQVLNGERYLYINDPLPRGIGGRYTITYREYISASDHTHWDDFYEITP